MIELVTKEIVSGLGTIGLISYNNELIVREFIEKQNIGSELSYSSSKLVRNKEVRFELTYNELHLLRDLIYNTKYGPMKSFIWGGWKLNFELNNHDSINAWLEVLDYMIKTNFKFKAC